MPILNIDLSSGDGRIATSCANCGAIREIPLNRASVETAPGDLSLDAAIDVDVVVDGGAPQRLELPAGTTTKSALRTKAAADINGVQVRESATSVVIESATTGPNSSIELVPRGGPQRRFSSSESKVVRRPELGAAEGDLVNDDAIPLPPCACGAQEFLIRSWDQAPARVQGTRFDKHRRAVNALAQHFIDQDWVHPVLRTGGSHADKLRRQPPPERLPLTPGQRLDIA